MPFAAVNGSFIFLAVVVLLFIAVIVASFSRRGSGIDEHPIDGRGESPGAGGPTEYESGEDEELPGNAGTK